MSVSKDGVPFEDGGQMGRSKQARRVENKHVSQKGVPGRTVLWTLLCPPAVILSSKLPVSSLKILALFRAVCFS